MSDGALVPGTLLAGKFRVVSRLGEGGMGAVYEIEHELTKHRRALKVLHKSMAALPSVVERFLREASAAGRVGNPHIVETFDAGLLESGEPYLVMELLRGEPLSSRIAHGPMPFAEVVELLGQAAAGVHAAHLAGIVHRDLKPDNLFITRSAEGRPFVKILDFGISKFDTQKTGGLQLTQEGAALGTPYYMPPEQIRGEGSLDARADVYALGVILYECLAGVRPFEAETLPHLAILIHSAQPRPLEQLRADLPSGFAELVHRAMAGDRELRTVSASALQMALSRYGALGSHSQLRNSPLPPPSPPSPPSVVPARSLAPPAPGLSTSAAGVSLRPVALRPKTRPALALGAVSVFLIGAGGGLAWYRARSNALEVASAGASASALPPDPGNNPVRPALALEPPLPSASASAGSPSVSPMLSVSPPPLASAARPAQSALASPALRVPGLHPSGRADERGLAKDNPFK